MNISFGQELKILIADGTENVPKKYDLEPKISDLSKMEIDEVKRIALEKEVTFENLNYQMSSEESNFQVEFEILDVAEGFFIFREIEFRAYLYSAYSQKMKRNYQGILVLGISNNGTKFTPKVHYVYKYRGDKFIRQISDFNGNGLSELAIFSQPPAKTIVKRFVRIIEFSAAGIEKLSSAEIYLSKQQSQRTPWNPPGSPPAKKVYIPPIITATKLFYLKKLNSSTDFFVEKWTFNQGKWMMSESLKKIDKGLNEDLTEYFEITKPILPARIGEKNK